MFEPCLLGSYNPTMNATHFIKVSRDAHNRAFYLPRLAREYYQADAVVFWTLTIFDKAQGWLTPLFHQRFRELMFHAAAREGLLCPIYCLMPDHLHLVWMGLRSDSDQLNGMAFLRTYLEPELAPAKFQPQAQDEVLREEQRKRNAFAKICFYIAANPVRAKLIGETGVWPFTSCVVPGYPKMAPGDEDFWPIFWGIYNKQRLPDAGNIQRPPIAGRQKAKLETPHVVSYEAQE
jgi:REP element-mobilizing transposase RayT